MNNDIKIRLVLSSKNGKTGDVPQTYTTGNTCPSSCWWRANGACYAKSGHCALHWQDKAGIGQWFTVDQLKKELKHKVVPGALIRHNVAGDIAVAGGSQIDNDLLSNLTKAYKGFKAYSYTHCPPTKDNLKAVKKANKGGFVVSFSCEKIETVKAARAAGLPAVLAVASMVKNKRVIDEITFIKCPNAVDPRVKCRDCQKCADPKRKSVIVFPCHGMKWQVKTATDSGYLLNL